ncbi:hypothetical protein E2542_SST30851 [Spatholobus suberectus]|nr:hypothetical protein E2542_SST30851 [Spatholobus suberectus]
MDDLPYLGPLSGNVDILVHFIEKGDKPNTIHNMDPDKSRIFDARDVVNLDNKGHMYVNMYVSRNRDDFLNKNANDAINVFVNDPTNESGNDNVEGNLNEAVNEPVNAVDGNEKVPVSDDATGLNEALLSSFAFSFLHSQKILNRCGCYWVPPFGSYNGVESSSGSSESDFDPIGECEDGHWSDENDSEVMSGFEETVDVIRNKHLDNDKAEIYV